MVFVNHSCKQRIWKHHSSTTKHGGGSNVGSSDFLFLRQPPKNRSSQTVEPPLDLSINVFNYVRKQVRQFERTVISFQTPRKCKLICNHALDLILNRTHADCTANHILTNTDIVSICCHHFIIATGKCDCHVDDFEKMKHHQTNAFISNHLLEIDHFTHWRHLGASELFHFLLHRGSVVHGFFSMWVINRRMTIHCTKTHDKHHQHHILLL